ncbi:MAG: hypothetical protein II822_07840 [Prevotella sp.]|nr:hypothetical protein [Prevotella sp.]
MKTLIERFQSILHQNRVNRVSKIWGTNEKFVPLHCDSAGLHGAGKISSAEEILFARRRTIDRPATTAKPPMARKGGNAEKSRQNAAALSGQIGISKNKNRAKCWPGGIFFVTLWQNTNFVAKSNLWQK